MSRVDDIKQSLTAIVQKQLDFRGIKDTDDPKVIQAALNDTAKWMNDRIPNNPMGDIILTFKDRTVVIDCTAAREAQGRTS